VRTDTLFVRFAEKIVLYPSDAFDLKVQKLRVGEVSWKSFFEARFVAAGLWPVASSGLFFSSTLFVL